MKSKRYITFLFLILGVLAVSAQSVEEQMNEVKLDDSLVYGEAFADDEGVAYEMALADLASYANSVRADAGKQPVSRNDFIPLVKELKLAQGARYQVVLYLSRATLMEMDGAAHQQIAQVIGGPSAAPSGPAPQPSQPAATTPLAQQQPAQSAPAPAVTPSSAAPASAVPDDVNMFLATQNTFVEIKKIVVHYKELGQIHTNGNTTSLSEVPADANIILFDMYGGVVAVLSPPASQPQINYATGAPDSPSSHTYKFIIWYK